MGVKLIYQTESLAFASTSGICGNTVWVTLLLGLKPRCRQETPFSHTQADSHTCNCTRPCETPFSSVLPQSNATLQGTPFSIISNLRYTTLPGTPFQWRIQDFPKVGAPTVQEGANIQFCQMFPKIAWNWKNLDPEGTPLDSPMLSVPFQPWVTLRAVFAEEEMLTAIVAVVMSVATWSN